MDDLDRQIIALLRENSRDSFIHMAEQVGTSEGTVRARVKRLTDEGVIRKFTVRTAGQNVKALVEVNVASNVQAGDVAAQIAAWEGVEAVWEVTGDNDIMVVADCHTPGKLNEVIDRIRSVEGTHATRSRLILKEY